MSCVRGFVRFLFPTEHFNNLDTKRRVAVGILTFLPTVTLVGILASPFIWRVASKAFKVKKAEHPKTSQVAKDRGLTPKQNKKEQTTQEEIKPVEHKVTGDLDFTEKPIEKKEELVEEEIEPIKSEDKGNLGSSAKETEGKTQLEPVKTENESDLDSAKKAEGETQQLEEEIEPVATEDECNLDSAKVAKGETQQLAEDIEPVATEDEGDLDSVEKEVDEELEKIERELKFVEEQIEAIEETRASDQGNSGALSSAQPNKAANKEAFDNFLSKFKASNEKIREKQIEQLKTNGKFFSNNENIELEPGNFAVQSTKEGLFIHYCNRAGVLKSRATPITPKEDIFVAIEAFKRLEESSSSREEQIEKFKREGRFLDNRSEIESIPPGECKFLDENDKLYVFFRSKEGLKEKEIASGENILSTLQNLIRVYKLNKLNKLNS